MPSPTLKVYVQPPIQSPTRWTMQRVTAAIDTHEQGDFSESGLLARAFGRDDRIGPCTQDRENALVGSDSGDFALVPVEGTWARRSKATINGVNEWWGPTVTSSWQRATLKSAIHIGVSLSFVEYERSSRRWTPRKLRLWHPENFFWSNQDQHYVARTVDGWVLIQEDDPNWFLYTPGGDESWLCGGVRGLGVPFVMRQWDWRDWARYNERHGLPIVVIHEPSGEGEAGSKEAFYRDVRKMGSTGFVRLPQAQADHNSYDIDLIEAKGKSHDSFDKFMERLNVAIAIYLKGQNLTTEVQGGAFASTAWHMRVRKDFAETDALTFGDALRERLIKPWGRFNVSSWNDEIAPWPHWNLEIPEDRQTLADAMLKGVQALALAASDKLKGVNLDLALMAETLGLPRLKAAPEQPVTEYPDPDEEEEQDEEENAGGGAEKQDEDEEE